MTTIDREHFWSILCEMHTADPESIKRLTAAISLPSQLCRFRSVNESTLKQLQDNKIYYSSADYYDDPFDTYFSINLTELEKLYTALKGKIDSGDTEFLSPINTMLGVDISEKLKQQSVNFTKLEHSLLSIRTMIQKNLFSICFCDNPYNETLWLKYANNYSGFVQVYDPMDESAFLCGKSEECHGCLTSMARPPIYPVHYSEEKYDATRFALAQCLFNDLPKEIQNNSVYYNLIIASLLWEAERITLNKKKCHQEDQEWRMIRPQMGPERSFIMMKAQKVILGLRMPAYKRKLVISAAQIAGIRDICELYINKNDELDSRPL